MSIGKTLFPAANREAALVAFLRTFWQVVRSTTWLGGGGLITVNALQLVHVNLAVLGYTAAAILISAVGSGALAAGDILKNGLPDAYSNAAIANIPAAVVSSVPIPAPADPSQPAAGAPPATVLTPTVASAASFVDLTALPAVAIAPQPEADPNAIEPVPAA